MLLSELAMSTGLRYTGENVDIRSGPDEHDKTLAGASLILSCYFFRPVK